MKRIAIYGIKNCDTMKKAFKWMDAHGIDYTFHDYKKQGIDENTLRTAMEQHGWEKVFNRRGTTWRKLPEEIKNSMSNASALQVSEQNPSIIKRPLLLYNEKIYVGFKENEYKKIFEC